MNHLLNDVTVFDFETTGLEPKECGVIEMAAIRVKDGEIISSFNTVVRQDVELNPKIIELTGITTEMMLLGMNESIAFKILRNIMGNSLLVAHNAAFDLSFLHHSMMRLGWKETFKNQFIDTCTIARERHTFPHKLTDMCERYGINLTGAHRALNDVIGCWELLRAMHSESAVDAYINKLGYVRKYGPPDWVPDYAEVVPVDLKFEERLEVISQ